MSVINSIQRGVTTVTGNVAVSISTVVELKSMVAFGGSVSSVHNSAGGRARLSTSILVDVDSGGGTINWEVIEFN